MPARFTPLVLLLSLAVLFAGCGSRDAAQQNPAPQWTLAYSADLANPNSADNEWLGVWGDVTVSKREKLVVKPGRRTGTVVCVYDGLEFPKDVRVELTASVTVKDPKLLCLGVCLNANGATQDSGYWLLFGNRGNTCSLLKREGKVIEETVAKSFPTDGKSCRIVAQNDDGKISLTVDDAPVFSWTDPAPLSGPGHALVGLCTYGCTITVEKFAVYAKKVGADPGFIAPPVVPTAAPVTIKGVMICSRQTDPRPDLSDHTLVLYAYDGTPEIRKDLQDILDKSYPDDGLDVARANRFQAELDKRLKYFLVPCHVARKEHHEREWNSAMCSVTGVVLERGGKKWILPTAVEQKAQFDFPAKMLAPDKPFVTPDKPPLILKADDKLSLKCVFIPAGSFIMGSPLYQWLRYQDEFPHEVVLTKPFYMSEIPITEEIFQGVMGKPHNGDNKPKHAVVNIKWSDINEFCKILSERSGRKVRLPTDAEWEYAARVGTSNPCFGSRYDAQKTYVAERDEPNLEPDVASGKPNAWGLYDMLSTGWCVDSDLKTSNFREKQVDPTGASLTAPKTEAIDYNYGVGCRKSKGGRYLGFCYPSMHATYWEQSGTAWEGPVVFRIVVEAEPPAPAPNP